MEDIRTFLLRIFLTGKGPSLQKRPAEDLFVHSPVPMLNPFNENDRNLIGVKLEPLGTLFDEALLERDVLKICENRLDQVSRIITEVARFPAYDGDLNTSHGESLC